MTLAVNGAPRRVPDRTVTEFAGDEVVDLLDLDRRPGHAVNLMVRTSPVAAAPALVIGRIDEHRFRTCVLAVALEPAGHIDAFDVLAPGPTAEPSRPLPVAMVHLSSPTPR